MVKAGKNKKASDSKIENVTSFHVWLITQALHRVLEKIRKHFHKIDAFISNVKKIF